MVRLGCGVYGDKAFKFFVDIQLNESVEELRMAIADKYNEIYHVGLASGELNLYKAGTKDGDQTTWLANDNNVKTLLQGDIDKKFTEMRSSYAIEDYFGQHFQPSRRQIHVLVDVSQAVVGIPPQYPSNQVAHDGKFTIKESDKEAYLIELAYYQQRGKLIQDNCKEYCDAILNKVEEFYTEGKDPLPFICVEGSSGMGKSQLAFALFSERPYFYWLATPVGESSQTMYQNFASISSKFNRFAHLDDPTSKREDDVLNSQSSFYKLSELWTYGFIRALVNYCSENVVTGGMIRFVKETSLRVAKCKLCDVREAIAAMKMKLPFFILDEAYPNVKIEGGKNLAAFQRNVFRVCGLVVVVMGTNSKITNLVAPSGGSFQEAQRLMALVPRFPPYQLDLNGLEKEAWNTIVGRYPILESIVMHSRGRFARLFTNQVLQIVKEKPDVELCALMDEAFASVNKSTQSGKRFLNSPEGKYAQLMAISFTNVEQPTSTEQSATKRPRLEVGSSSMHVHFANLVDESIIDISSSHGNLAKGIVYWKVKCCFPPISQDVLLYLSILGGKAFPSYLDACTDTNFSTKRIFTETKGYPENSHATSNDYKSFENMVAHAIFSSSRRHGVQGIPFNDFISCLIGEFQDEVWTKMTLNLPVNGNSITQTTKGISASDLLEGYSKIQKLLENGIPFLAPPNSEWPESVLKANQYGCNFGHLVRAFNSDRCDIYVKDLKNNDEELFLCECKYWEAGITSRTMTNIIQGISEQWTWELVVVFCPRLKFRGKWRFPTTGCVKINCQDASVEWIFQPEDKINRKRLVIVMEIPGCKV